MELAGRLDRLWAAIIDRLLILLLVLIAALAMPALRRDSSAIFIAVFCIAALALLIAQCWLLTTRGQTIGKRIMGLRIALVKDLSNGGFVINVLLRGTLNWVITAVPIIGTIYVFADPLCIFREDRRCLHDHIAGTCVIKE